MNERACTNCHFITKEFSGIVIMFDPATSVIAKAMNIKEKGRYALKVR
jgi:RNA polymerase subunit RPABC4/transcription elongation factor Spt4